MEEEDEGRRKERERERKKRAISQCGALTHDFTAYAGASLEHLSLSLFLSSCFVSPCIDVCVSE